jgi:hypothetical protein
MVKSAPFEVNTNRTDYHKVYCADENIDVINGKMVINSNTPRARNVAFANKLLRYCLPCMATISWSRTINIPVKLLYVIVDVDDKIRYIYYDYTTNEVTTDSHMIHLAHTIKHVQDIQQPQIMYNINKRQPNSFMKLMLAPGVAYTLPPMANNESVETLLNSDFLRIFARRTQPLPCTSDHNISILTHKAVILTNNVHKCAKTLQKCVCNMVMCDTSQPDWYLQLAVQSPSALDHQYQSMFNIAINNDIACFPIGDFMMTDAIRTVDEWHSKRVRKGGWKKRKRV